CEEARQDADRKEREAALAREEARVAENKAILARDEARVAEIKAAQARTARLQRTTRWAVAAVAAVVLIAAALLGLLQRDNARELDRREIALNYARANALAQLSTTQRLRGEIDSALRLASHGTRIDLALPSDKTRASHASAALAAAVALTHWRLSLIG